MNGITALVPQCKRTIALPSYACIYFRDLTISPGACLPDMPPVRMTDVSDRPCCFHAP